MAGLFEIKQSADAKHSAEMARREKQKVLAALSVHPLLKWNCDRNVCEAYFQGIGFAALTDDVDIDAAERKVIARIGDSLAIPAEDQEEMLSTIKRSVESAVKDGGRDVFLPLLECVRELKGENVIRLFAAEYLKVCGVKAFNAETVRNALTGYVFAPAKAAFDPKYFQALIACVVKGAEVPEDKLVVLADTLGDDTLRYLLLDLLGDVADRLASARKSIATKARAKKESARIAKVRKGFEDELEKIGEEHENDELHKCFIEGWDDEFRKRLEPFNRADIDWPAMVTAFLSDLAKLPVSRGRRILGILEDALVKRRLKLLWKLFGMLWVAEKTIFRAKCLELLLAARMELANSFQQKVEDFVAEAFKGDLELVSSDEDDRPLK